MPSWTRNALDVWCERDDPLGARAVSEFRQVAARHAPEALTLRAVWPEPGGFGGGVRLVGDDVVVWRHRHWGVKWDVRAVVAQEHRGDMRYWFETPYAAPLGWMKYASSVFPRCLLRLAFVSDDRQAAGYVVYQAGTMIDTAVAHHPDRWRVDAQRFLAPRRLQALLSPDDDAVAPPATPLPAPEYPPSAFDAIT